MSLSILCYKHFYHFRIFLVRLRVVLSAQRYGFFGIVKKKRTKTGNPFVINKCFEEKVLNENIGDVLLKILWNTIFLNNLSYNKEKVVFLQL